MTFKRFRTRSRPRNGDGRRDERRRVFIPTTLPFELKPVIGIKADFEVNDLPTAQIQSNNGAKKMIRMTDGASKESVLYCTVYYDTMCAALDFSPKQKIANAKDFLDPSLHEYYDTAITANNINLNANNIQAVKYTQLIASLMTSLFSATDRPTMIEFLRSHHHLRMLPKDH